MCLQVALLLGLLLFLPFRVAIEEERRRDGGEEAEDRDARDHGHDQTDEGPVVGLKYVVKPGVASKNAEDEDGNREAAKIAIGVVGPPVLLERHVCERRSRDDEDRAEDGLCRSEGKPEASCSCSGLPSVEDWDQPLGSLVGFGDGLGALVGDQAVVDLAAGDLPIAAELIVVGHGVPPGTLLAALAVRPSAVCIGMIGTSRFSFL